MVEILADVANRSVSSTIRRERYEKVLGIAWRCVTLVLVPILSVLMAAVAMASSSPADAVFQIGADDCTYGSGQRYVLGDTISGYKFTIAARPSGELPLWQESYVSLSSYFLLYRKQGNGQYAVVAMSANRDNDSDIGVLLPAGDYLLERSQAPHRLLIGGTWASAATQAKYWSITYNDVVQATIPLEGGGTLDSRSFSITARPDGALPYAVIDATLYRKNGAGNYEVFALGSFEPILLPAGDYAIPGGQIQPSNNFYTRFWGIWVDP